MEVDFIKPFESLKNLLTDETIKSTSKFSMPKNIRNYARFIATTNNKNPIPLRGGWDRRFWFTKVSQEKVGDKEYFDMLKSKLNQETANHFFTYLMGLDISTKNVKNPPKTPELESLKEISLPATEKFFQELKNGIIPRPLCLKRGEDKQEKYFAFHARSLYSVFKSWCQEEGYKKVPNTIEFKTACSKNCEVPTSADNLQRITINKEKRLGWWIYGLEDEDIDQNQKED